MRESFSEYKKTIESNLLGVDYLYAGDVIKSLDRKVYSEIKSSPLTSPTFIINCIKQIYKDSFDSIKQKSIDLVIPTTTGEQLDVVYLKSKIDSFFGSSKYIFSSKETNKFIGINKPLDKTRGLPDYFYPMKSKFVSGSDIYFSPEVEEEDGIYFMYVTNNAFQSMVYVLQNMEYEMVENDPENGVISWTHSITYQLYDCKFSSVRVVIKNVSKIRDEKINQILS